MFLSWVFYLAVFLRFSYGFFGGRGELAGGVRTDQLSDSGSEDLKAGLCCVLAGAQALRCALRMWLC